MCKQQPQEHARMGDRTVQYSETRGIAADIAKKHKVVM